MGGYFIITLLKFTAKSVGETILKIGQYLAKFEAKNKFNIVALFPVHGLYMKSKKSVCLCVSLFLMHGYNFEPIWTKFGVWYRYTLRMRAPMEPAGSRSGKFGSSGRQA